MATDESGGQTEDRPQPLFLTTHWSVVLAAGHGDTTRADDALAHLCQTYWYPLYAYVRRRGHAVADAQDLTQAFFERLLERRWIESADHAKGRFRTFLLTALNRFLSDEWDKARAQKRGGGVAHVPVQLDTAETRYGAEPSDNSTPEQYYERRWALTLLDTVLQNLRAEYEHTGKDALFAALNPTLIGARQSQPYAELAAQLDMNEGAVKVAIHRLRRRFREVIKNEISQTVNDRAQVDAELHYLLEALL